MVSQEYENGISEVLAILECSEPEYEEKIPKKLMKFLKENQSKTYKPEIDSSKKIKEMNLLPETKGLLSILYLKYWSTPKEEEEFRNILKDNQKKYDEELRQKYNPDNIFKDVKEEENLTQQNQTFENNKRVEKDESLVEYKGGFMSNLIQKIKEFFYKIFNKK